MDFSRLQAKYAIWEDSPIGRLTVKLLPLTLFSLVATTAVWYLQGEIEQVTAVQDDQNTVILDQKKRIDALEQQLNANTAAPSPVSSPVQPAPASPEASPVPSP